MRDFFLGGLVVGGLLVACAAGGERRGPARAGVERLDCAEHVDEDAVQVAFPEGAIIELRECNAEGICYSGGDRWVRVVEPGVAEFQTCAGRPEYSAELHWIAVD